MQIVPLYGDYLVPFIGILNGDRVLPRSVDSDQTVVCPECGGEMGVKDRYWNNGKLISSHFYHLSSGDGCGGESSIHARMKVLAADRLEEIFPHSSVTVEQSIGDRFADVCVEFPEPMVPYGKGIIVEAQFKNKGKNHGVVQNEYFNHGYSVYWMYLSDVKDEMSNVDFQEHRLRTVWPEAVPEHDEWSGQNDYVVDLHETLDSTPSIDINIPVAYLEDHIFDIYTPSENTFEGWNSIGKAWIHGVGNTVSWFKLHSTDTGAYVLEYWKRNKRKDKNEHIYLSLPVDYVDNIEQFVFDISDSLKTGRAFEQRSDSLDIIETVSIPGVNNTRGWMSFCWPPDGGLRFIVGRKGRNGNSRTLSTDWRDGDDSRLQDELLPLIRKIKK